MWKVCDVVPIFFCFSLILSSFFRASTYAVFAFSNIILPTQILLLSTETKNNTSSDFSYVVFDNSLAASSSLITFSCSCKSCSLFARHSFSFISISFSFCSFQSFLLVSFPTLSFSLFFLLSLDMFCLN